MPFFETTQYRTVAAPIAAQTRPDPVTPPPAPPPPVAGLSDPIGATVTALSRLGRREKMDLINDETWQAKVRLYDREGPGIVGAALDMPAATSMLIDLCVRKRTASGYQVVKDDPVLTAILQMWRGETMDQRHLFSRVLRTMDGPAECYMIMRNGERGQGRIYWQLAQTTNVTPNHDGTVTVRTRPGAREGDQWHHTIANKWVYHCMNSDLEWEGTPWSPMRRAIPHIEQYKAAMRTISRNLDSQLALNGILWAKAVGEATDWPDVLKAWGYRAVTGDDGPESTIPFPMQTAEEPKFIDVGRKDHKDQLEVAEMFLKAFAQSTDLPTQMLLEGPGQGNHWSSYIESDHYADVTLAPRWRRVCALITETHLRPMLEGLPRTAGHLNPADYEVWADDTRIRTKTDNTERVLKAREMGVASREALAAAVGLDPDDIMKLPEGTTDWDAWLATRSENARINSATDALDPDDDVSEPDRDLNDSRRDAQLESGPPDPMVAQAVIEVEGELKNRRSSYWHDLVPG